MDTTTKRIALVGRLTGSGAVIESETTTCVVSTQTIAVDGLTLGVAVYNIGGYNYVKLRDVGAALDFGVGWDSAGATIAIDAAAHYTADK